MERRQRWDCPVTATAEYHTQKKIPVEISYTEKVVTDNRSTCAMPETLDGILRPYFKIGDRAFTCDDRPSVTDDIGHYMFTISFTDTVPYTESGPAEELRIRWKGDTDGTP